MAKPSKDTVDALLDLYGACETWEATAAALHFAFSPGTLWRCAHGYVTHQNEAIIRHYLDLPPIERRQRRRTDTTKYTNLTNDDIHRILEDANTQAADCKSREDERCQKNCIAMFAARL